MPHGGRPSGGRRDDFGGRVSVATYKYKAYLEQVKSPVFDTEHQPGDRVRHGGLYRCATCGFEACVSEGQRLPSATRCDKHSAAWHAERGNVIWRLAVFAMTANAAL
jgi:hypothetical protein